MPAKKEKKKKKKKLVMVEKLHHRKLSETADKKKIENMAFSHIQKQINLIRN